MRSSSSLPVMVRMKTTQNTLFKSALSIRLLAALAVATVSACSGVDVTPDAIETFAATDYTRYAWRSEPPSQTGSGKDKLSLKSPVIRAAFEEKMSELGYRRVDKDDAEFLVEYMVAAGHNDGQLLHGGSNEMLYPSSVNRQIDGASADNAYALSGIVETGKIMLVFVDASTIDLLWRVQMSIVVQDANRIDADEVRRAVRQGLSVLPPVS
jgi:hypothetical protein